MAVTIQTIKEVEIIVDTAACRTTEEIILVRRGTTTWEEATAVPVEIINRVSIR
jgi:hypothetical protein